MSNRITRRSTCVDFFDKTQLDICCDRCKKILDSTSNNRSRNAAMKKECMRFWDDKWMDHAFESKVMMHVKSRNKYR